ncbi:2-oxo-hepta-3-ene-1,7-dioic acid hydratase [Mameliella alba]|nr:2-oxo-hepta-3-ene-1,7-dioic acid hydratase [Antarctobacter heliothermus]MBY6147132.1 2-oxo-hepta-3-ene-1,7-dioic acid hydratase [Mameliella alba]MCA0957138.1 2-oxo-hepta-3-ene-1,7-dioic acid hydratase [Mameliella alba]
MTEDEIHAAAQALVKAEAGRQQIGLLSLAYPGMTMDDAYAVQASYVTARQAQGRRQVGWKIGLTSRAMQDALGIETPDSGVLLDDMVFENGGVVPRGRFIQPRVEAEIAFVMKAPLQGVVTREEVIAATDYVCASLEILDTRILRRDPASGQLRNVCDTIADNAANAGIVLGDRQVNTRLVDLRWTGAIVARDGVVEETGLGAGVLNDPVMGIVWLVERLAGYGQGLVAGQVVLSGSFIRPVECPPGCMVEADFGEFGAVAISFE